MVSKIANTSAIIGARLKRRANAMAGLPDRP
jgi:hypothetical protein